MNRAPKACGNRSRVLSHDPRSGRLSATTPSAHGSSAPRRVAFGSPPTHALYTSRDPGGHANEKNSLFVERMGGEKSNEGNASCSEPREPKEISASHISAAAKSVDVLGEVESHVKISRFL